MKVLVLSLLRLGDIIMHREIVRSLKKQDESCEVHFLIHSQFESVQKIMPEVDCWHFLPRNEIQKILVERDQSPLKAFEVIENLVSDLNSRQFDLVLNATHNRFSVRFMDLLKGGEKRGVALESGRKTADANRWQGYLNEHFSQAQGSRFHYVEVLNKSLGLAVAPAPIADRRSPRLILLQLLTSDAKKNWGLRNFRELKKMLEEQFPDDKVLGLCSPDEKSQVSSVFDWNEFISPSLAEVSELLKQARLLITGDTSIQHLAAQQNCPVLSLFLGSADPRKTAPWQAGAWVIQGQAPCAPCSHSSACFQKEHLCATSVSVRTVFDLANGILNDKAVRLHKVQAFQMRSDGASLSLEGLTDTLAQKIEHAVWTAYLDQTPISQSHNLKCRESDVAALLNLHNRFEIAVQAFKAGNAGLEEIQVRFPMWKDSLMRLVLDSTCQAGWEELEELISIRRKIFNNLSHQMGASHGGNEGQSFERPLAEA